MEIEIKEVSSQLVPEFLYFFDHVGFEEHNKGKGCYCMNYHWNREMEQYCRHHTEEESINFRRVMAVQYLNLGKLRGYLAYVDGQLAGWCNCNDKTNYTRLPRGFAPLFLQKGQVKSVVCFTVSPAFRRQGVAVAMLERVCADAAEEGFSFIEAYPDKRVPTERSYHGSPALFEQAGFVRYREKKTGYVYRKQLS